MNALASDTARPARAYPLDCPGFDANPDWHDLRSRVSTVEQSQVRIEAAVERIAESMECLVRLEERQAEIRSAQAAVKEEQKELEKRVLTIETQLPGLIELRKWVIGGILGTLGIVGAALLALVVHAPK